MAETLVQDGDTLAVATSFVKLLVSASSRDPMGATLTTRDADLTDGFPDCSACTAVMLEDDWVQVSGLNWLVRKPGHFRLQVSRHRCMAISGYVWLCLAMCGKVLVSHCDAFVTRCLSTESPRASKANWMSRLTTRRPPRPSF